MFMVISLSILRIFLLFYVTIYDLLLTDQVCSIFCDTVIGST